MTSTKTSLHSKWSSLLSLLFLLLLFNLPSPLLALSPDGILLLAFKYAVLNDPLSVLGDWNYDDDTPCSWNGVMCMGFPAAGGGPTALNWSSTNSSTTSRVISLVVPNSQLLGSIAPDLGLIEHLRHLDLSGNFLNGTLPASLFNASELRILSLSNNEISGELPELVEKLGSLQVLNLSDNALTGGVPTNLTLLPNLTLLALANNYLSGGLPGGGFDRLEVFDLSSNLVNGSVPPDLAGSSLLYLNLSSNRLAGEIPIELGARFPDTAMIDFSFNNLTGGIPQSGAFLTQKSTSFAGNPDLCGKPLKNPCTIPSTLSNPPNVTTTGPQVSDSPPAFAAIPKTPAGDSPAGNAGGGSQGQGGLRPATIAAIIIGDLAGIGILFVVFLYVYLAKKKKRLQQEQQQQKNLRQERVVGVKKIERGSKEERESKGNGGLSWCLRKKGGDGDDSEETSETAGSSETEEAEEEGSDKKGEEGGGGKSQAQGKQQQGATLVTVDGEVELEMETLLKASAYILGATGSSIVYKAVLADGTALAVRRIGESCSIDKFKDFEAQIRGIAKFRHPNLLRLWGFYWGPDEKLLIYDYALNGSLANISFSKKLGSSPFHLSWEARLRIARGVARGLAYIHEKKSVHGNVKPSNILLGSDMEPRIGDFGLDRLLSGDGTNKPGSSARLFGSKRSMQSQNSLPELSPVPGASPIGSSSTAVLSPLPYQAPESLKNLKPNAKWDVYSFGMVLLELMSGRVFSEVELSQWNAGFVVEERSRVLRMADPSMRGEVEGKEEALLSCFKLGFACASMAPQRRPSIKDVLLLLEKIPSTSSASPSFY